MTLWIVGYVFAGFLVALLVARAVNGSWTKAAEVHNKFDFVLLMMVIMILWPFVALLLLVYYSTLAALTLLAKTEAKK